MCVGSCVGCGRVGCCAQRRVPCVLRCAAQLAAAEVEGVGGAGTGHSGGRAFFEVCGL